MKKESIKKGLLTGTLIGALAVFRVTLEYVFGFEFLYSNWTSLIVYISYLGIPIILGYTLFKFLRKLPFLFRFTYGISTLLTIATITVTFNLFLHEVLDKDYRYVYAERIITRSKESLEKFEKQNNVIVENKNDTENMTEKIVNKYTPKNQLTNLAKGIPFIVILGTVVALAILRSDKERLDFRSVNP